jgi:putative addiction module component (TIGR02574 family)
MMAELVRVNAMAVSLKSLGIDRLGIEERLALVEELWDSITADPSAVPLTEAQRAELDRRIAEHDANPDEVVPWEEVKALITDRLKR